MTSIDVRVDSPHAHGGAQTFDTIVGTSGGDNLFGTGGDDVISGKGGSDVLFGLDGADLINGGIGSDYLNGGTGADTLHGGAGDDFLKGGPGDDSIDGGDGFDRVSFLGATNAVHVDLHLQGAAQDTGDGMDTLVSIENLSGSAYSDVLTGDDNANIIASSGGDDTMSGAGGNDLFANVDAGNLVIDGGAGSDTVQIDSNGAGDITSSYVDLNIHTAQATGSGSLTLTGIENLSGSPNDVITDTFIGDRFDNVLAGGQGDDVLHGNNGADLLLGDGDIQANYGDAGYSGSAETLLEGVGAGADTLDGGAGADTLIGGAGSDNLTGGSGVDNFVYLSTGDSNASGGVDLITDLSKKDVIDVSAIDADTAASGDQAFHIVHQFHDQAGELVRSYDAGADVTHFMFDVNGDGVSDFQIDVTGDHHGFANFVL